MKTGRNFGSGKVDKNDDLNLSVTIGPLIRLYEEEYYVFNRTIA